MVTYIPESSNDQYPSQNDDRPIVDIEMAIGGEDGTSMFNPRAFTDTTIVTEIVKTSFYAESRVQLPLYGLDSKPFFNVNTNKYGKVNFYLESISKWPLKGYMFPDHFYLWCFAFTRLMEDCKLDNILFMKKLTEDEELLVAWLIEVTMYQTFSIQRKLMPFRLSGTAEEVFKDVFAEVKDFYTRVQKDEEWSQIRVDETCCNIEHLNRVMGGMAFLEFLTRDTTTSNICQIHFLVAQRVRNCLSNRLRDEFDEQMMMIKQREPMGHGNSLDALRTTVINNCKKKGRTINDSKPCSVCKDDLHHVENCPFLKHSKVFRKK